MENLVSQPVTHLTDDYSAAHCWQYEIRLKNLEEDLKAAGLTKEDAEKLRVGDFEFSYFPKTEFQRWMEIVQFIRRHEWLGKMPNRPTHRFIATYKGLLAGVIVMATPNSFSNLLGEEDRNLEKLISRGACISWSPKNLASALIMFSIRWMVKNTGFRVFTAYGDVAARELGTIYQACNFIYLGQNSGTRYEYFDTNYPDHGWFTDRQFRQTSQIKRYCRELGIHWRHHWDGFNGNGNRIVDWSAIPDKTAEAIKLHAKSHKALCKMRMVEPKHKYVYFAGLDRKETKNLLAKFKTLHPELQNIPYPKHRGPTAGSIDLTELADTAAKETTRPCQPLLENFEDCRPADEESEIKNGFITIKEVAKMMRVSTWTIYSLVKTDPTFPSLNVGLKKKFVVDRQKLKAWTESKSAKGSF